MQHVALLARLIRGPVGMLPIPAGDRGLAGRGWPAGSAPYVRLLSPFGARALPRLHEKHLVPPELPCALQKDMVLPPVVDGLEDGLV